MRVAAQARSPAAAPITGPGALLVAERRSAVGLFLLDGRVEKIHVEIPVAVVVEKRRLGA